jgi:hypothetical protein
MAKRRRMKRRARRRRSNNDLGMIKTMGATAAGTLMVTSMVGTVSNLT